MAEVEGISLVAQSVQREGVEVLFGLAGGPIAEALADGDHDLQLRPGQLSDGLRTLRVRRQGAHRSREKPLLS